MHEAHGALIQWFGESQRTLPWRSSYDPYHVWISEVMLQQTQVETVVPYFERWMAKLPDIPSLATADEPTVLSLWAGLGYYNRARNLMAAARIVVEEHRGRIPADYDTLISLPGVGQYMAGAILSIAFNKPYPVVDGNVRRVLSRVYGWTEESPKAMWEAASRIVREAEPRMVNQAVADLGSTALLEGAPDEWLTPSAGLPLYPALFGRDSLTACWQAALFDRGSRSTSAPTACATPRAGCRSRPTR